MAHTYRVNWSGQKDIHPTSIQTSRRISFSFTRMAYMHTGIVRILYITKLRTHEHAQHTHTHSVHPAVIPTPPLVCLDYTPIFSIYQGVRVCVLYIIYNVYEDDTMYALCGR